MTTAKDTGARSYRIGRAVERGARPAEAHDVVALDQRSIHAGPDQGVQRIA